MRKKGGSGKDPACLPSTARGGSRGKTERTSTTYFRAVCSCLVRFLPPRFKHGRRNMSLRESHSIEFLGRDVNVLLCGIGVYWFAVSAGVEEPRCFALTSGRHHTRTTRPTVGVAAKERPVGLELSTPPPPPRSLPPLPPPVLCLSPFRPLDLPPAAAIVIAISCIAAGQEI